MRKDDGRNRDPVVRGYRDNRFKESVDSIFIQSDCEEVLSVRNLRVSYKSGFSGEVGI